MMTILGFLRIHPKYDFYFSTKIAINEMAIFRKVITRVNSKNSGNSPWLSEFSPENESFLGI